MNKIEQNRRRRGEKKGRNTAEEDKGLTQEERKKLLRVERRQEEEMNRLDASVERMAEDLVIEGRGEYEEILNKAFEGTLTETEQAEWLKHEHEARKSTVLANGYNIKSKTKAQKKLAEMLRALEDAQESKFDEKEEKRISAILESIKYEQEGRTKFLIEKSSPEVVAEAMRRMKEDTD